MSPAIFQHLFSFLAMYYYITTPNATMREKPTTDSESVSEGYFSEEVKILTQEKDWIKIQTVVDGYEGWVKENEIVAKEGPFPPKGAKIGMVKETSAPLNKEPTDVYAAWKMLPFESKLEILDTIYTSSYEGWYKVRLPSGEIGYISIEDVVINPKLLNVEEMIELSKKFVGLPYVWGGRSSFGYDCSGYIQMLFRQMGHHIPRDANPQMYWEGFEEISVEELQPGDILFLGRKKIGKASHLGLYIGEGLFIQTSTFPPGRRIKITPINAPYMDKLFIFKTGRRLKNRS